MFATEQTLRCGKSSIFVVSEDTVYTRTFRRAMDTLGGVEPLARALGASVQEVEAWAGGLMAPPPGAFLLAIDIVARPGLRRAAQS